MSQVKVGDIYPTNEGGSVIVVEYGGWSSISVRHMDDHRHMANVRSDHLVQGGIKNPFHPSVFGLGYIGVGGYMSRESRTITPVYLTWRNMFMRCYGPAYQAKYPTYKGCAVASEWHNFQAFAKWFDDQDYSRECGFDLDKDLIALGNKTYSPDTCSFVPHAVNTILLDRVAVRGNLPQGVSAHGKRFRAQVSVNGKTSRVGTYTTPELASIAYVAAKKSAIKAVAENWKAVLLPEVYKNLCTWEVGQ